MQIRGLFAVVAICISAPITINHWLTDSGSSRGAAELCRGAKQQNSSRAAAELCKAAAEQQQRRPSGRKTLDPLCNNLHPLLLSSAFFTLHRTPVRKEGI